MPDDQSHSSNSVGPTAKNVETDDTSSSQAKKSYEDKKPAAARRKKKDDVKLDVEGSAREEEKLVAAKDIAREKAKRSDATQEDKDDERRRASNRLSAYYSRKRRKGQVVDLEEQVVLLQQCNAEQAEQLGEQKAKISSIREKNERLRKQAGSLDSSFESYAAASDRRQHVTPAGVASSNEDGPDANESTAPQMTLQLKTLQHQQQQFDQSAQRQLQLKIRQETQDTHGRERQSLDTVQLKEQDDLETKQQQDRKQLTLSHGQQLSEVLHGFGIAASNQMEVVQLMQELGEIQRREVEIESFVAMIQTRRPAAAALDSSTAGTGVLPAGVAVSESAQASDCIQQDINAEEAAESLNALRQQFAGEK
jgi:bZIP transcription factor